MRKLLAISFVFVASLASAQTRSLFVEDLTWPEIRDQQAAGKTTAIVFAGGLEQNGHHMALAKHNVIARHVAGQIAEKLGNALVYPIVPYSMAGDPIEKTGHMRLPGTVSLSSEVFMGVVRQVALSAISGGFKNVFLLGDHGGGQSELRLAAEGLDADWRAKGVHVYYIPNTGAAQKVNAYLKERNVPAGGHAGVAETAQIMFLDQQQPRLLRRDKFAAAAAGPESVTGANGDPSLATAEMGRIFLDYKATDAVDQIKKALTPAK